MEDRLKFLWRLILIEDRAWVDKHLPESNIQYRRREAHQATQ